MIMLNLRKLRMNECRRVTSVALRYARFELLSVACSQITGFTDSTQTIFPPFWQTVFVGGNKIIHSSVWMRFLPLRI
jgi:hypothetical protein